MVKKALSILMFFSFFSVAYSLAQYPGLDSAILQQKTDEVAQLVSGNRLHRRMLYACLGVAAVGSCAVLLKPSVQPLLFSGEPQSLDEKMNVVLAASRRLESALAATDPIRAYAAARMQEEGGVISWVRSSIWYIVGGFAANELTSMVNGAVGPVTSYAKRFEGFVGKQYEKLFYEPNMLWYLQHYADLPLIFKQLDAHAQALADPSVVDAHDHIQAVEDSWNILCVMAHGIVGFMTWKIETTGNELIKPRLHALAKQVEALINKAADNLSAEGLNADERIALIASLRSSLEIALQAFTDFELLAPYAV